MPNRDDFAAARKAAIDCATASGWLLRVAAGLPEPAPAMKRETESLLDKHRWWDSPPIELPDPTPILLVVAIKGLCEALASGWGVMSKVQNELILVAPGPATSGGMTRSTAHRLAWDFAHHLWLSIRNLDPRLDTQFYQRPIDPSRFDLDEDALRECTPAILAKLAGRPSFDAGRVKALIEHESSRAMARLESAHTERSGPSPEPAIPPAPPRENERPAAVDASGTVAPEAPGLAAMAVTRRRLKPGEPRSRFELLWSRSQNKVYGTSLRRTSSRVLACVDRPTTTC